MMTEKPYDEILSEIETHCDNATELLKKSYKIHMSALDSENADDYISKMSRATEFQTFSIREMQKALELQHTFSRQMNSLHLKSKFR